MSGHCSVYADGTCKCMERIRALESEKAALEIRAKELEVDAETWRTVHRRQLNRAEQAEEAVRQITRSDMQQTLALKKAEARADGNYQVVEKLRAQLGKAEAEKCPEPSHHATVARQFHRISVLEAELAAAERGIRNAISAKDKNHADYILNESLKRATGP